MTTEIILVPEERKPVLIGRKGSTKAMIENTTHATLIIKDSVEVSGELIEVMSACNIVTAIARGFSPSEAMLLADEDYGIEIITLRNETKKSLKRVLARVIGRDGKALKFIEKETGARLCVYGKTISIIGEASQLARAREAVEMLLIGKTHSYVFGRLRKS